MYHIRWNRYDGNLIATDQPLVTDETGAEMRLYVVEYSRRQRIEHIALLEKSLTTNFRRFMADTSGDWEILAICRDSRTAYQFAANLREEYPERFILPKKRQRRK